MTGPHPGQGGGPAGGPPRPRRPAFLEPSSLDGFGTERLDPAVITEIAHETASILLHTGRSAQDPALTERLVRLVDELGLDTVAELWSQRPARSLPGALWRLYVLREWVRRDPVGAAHDFAEGVRLADVSAAIAGVASPPGPEQIRELADAVLRGLYAGDVGIALDRAAAFCRVVAAGRATRDPDARQPVPPAGAVGRQAQAPTPQEVSLRHARSAAAVQTMAEDLSACASLWRAEGLV